MCLESWSTCFAARDKYSGGIWRKRIAQILFPRWVLGWDTINSYVCFISKSPFVYRACATPGLQFKRAVKSGLAWAHTSILTNLVWTVVFSPPPPSPSRLAPAPRESHRGQSGYSSKLKTVRRRIFPSYSMGKRNTETFSLHLGHFWVFFFPFEVTHRKNRTQQEETRSAEPQNQQHQLIPLFCSPQKHNTSKRPLQAHSFHGLLEIWTS